MISVYIIAFNEQDKIGAAVRSVQWADEIIVADSFSTDKTVKIAESLGARVIQIPFRGFGDLRNRAMEACSNDWIFSLDSDERCTQEVREEILGILAARDSLDAYYVPRKNFFMGKWIRRSGFYPDYRQPQVFRQGVIRFLDDPVHERYEVKSDKPCGYLKNAIHQIPFKSLDEILYKANRYSSLGARKLAQSGVKPGKFKAVGHALWSFVQHYLLKRGFLDGWPGFIIAFGNFEGTFYKYAKLYEQSCTGTDLNANPEQER